jgi:hypothetical protein
MVQLGPGHPTTAYSFAGMPADLRAASPSRLPRAQARRFPGIRSIDDKTRYSQLSGNSPTCAQPAASIASVMAVTLPVRRRSTEDFDGSRAFRHIRCGGAPLTALSFSMSASRETTT